ncbi:MAG TPA: SEC-C metal-binding domain-containing protein [Candidatus Eremiobacteraceae bacterium]|nr:SEC-C metal-binding domain-containing protein [Candidatus Eremiobacteraceae bacterium]
MAPEVGRNDPCPCGSGKKYKRCCGAVSIAMPAYGRTESSRINKMLMSLAGSDRMAGPHTSALDEFFAAFFDEASEDEKQLAVETEQAQAAFHTWFMYDRPIVDTGERLCDMFASLVGLDLTAGQRTYLDRMSASHMRPYEVRDVKLDSGVMLRDEWSGVDLWVSERTASHTLRRYDTMFARVTEGPTGTAEFNGGVLVLPRVVFADLLKHLRASYRGKLHKRRDLSEREFFKESAPKIHSTWLNLFIQKMPKLTTTDGQPLEIQTLVFDILDRPRLVGALDAHPDFEPEMDVRYRWLADAPTDGGSRHTLLGTVTVGADRLECMVWSAERNRRFRALIDSIAPGSLRFRVTAHTDVRRGLQDARESRGEDYADGISTDDHHEIATEYLNVYYRRWVDEAIPALGGRTPREVARIPRERNKVAELIKIIEQDSAHGDPSISEVDVSWMWEELGLNGLR